MAWTRKLRRIAAVQGRLRRGYWAEVLGGRGWRCLAGREKPEGRSPSATEEEEGGQWVGWWMVGDGGRMWAMKMVVLRSWLAAAAALGESLAILDLKGVVPLLPEGWAVWVAGVPTLAALVVHVVKGVEDSLKKMELDGDVSGDR